MRAFWLGGLLAAAWGAWAAQAAPQEKDSEPKTITTDSGLKYQDIKAGTGPAVKNGDTVIVHYTGWLKDGTKFDSSHNPGREPLQLTLPGRVIKGWNEGLLGMKAGGVRKLIIPPKLAYGAQGRPPVIPPDAELTFEIELLRIR